MYRETKQGGRTVKGRHCRICGRPGGNGATTLLRDLGYAVPHGAIEYAHSNCLQRIQRRLRRAATVQQP